MGKLDESARAARTAARADSSSGEATAVSDGAGTDAAPPASVPAPALAVPSEPAAAAMRQQQAQTGNVLAAAPKAPAASAAEAVAGDAALRAAPPATAPPAARAASPTTAPPAAAPAPAPPAKPHEAAPAKKTADEFDPMGWEVSVICKDCEKGFKVPYRHFQVGVVFHCPHCHGSYVPKMTMHRMVRNTFETFYGKRKREREEFARSGGDEAVIKRKQERELEEFHKRLDQLAHEMRPAGKLVRPKGIGAMFT